MKSLHGFCKEHDLPKTSVKRFLNDEGFDTSSGLSREAIAAALVEFKPKGSAPNPDVLPPNYADPFAGVASGRAIVPTGYQATDRSLAVLMSEQRVRQLCEGAALTNQQTVQAGVHNSINLGQQLGAFLGEQTIRAAEQQRKQMIEQYLQSQGVQTSPKSPGGSPDGNAA